MTAYLVSLVFTFLGAAVFSTIRGRRARIPQEAVIGICYAVASAAAILAMSKSVEQTEHLKEMLVGNILTVSWFEVGKTAALYAAIGLFHYIYRRNFLTISLDPELAEKSGISVRFWDFLFYASFGFVVTSSVAIAGVRRRLNGRRARSACTAQSLKGRVTSRRSPDPFDEGSRRGRKQDRRSHESHRSGMT